MEEISLKLKPIAPDEDKSDPMFDSEYCRQLLSMYNQFYPKTGFILPWVGYFVMHHEQIVGSCSFVGPPNDGRVEIAYWTFSEYEGRGIASFACKELIKIAKMHQPGIIITANTAPEHNASTKILEKNGFRYSGIVQDDDIGDAWQWLLRPENTL